MNLRHVRSGSLAHRNRKVLYGSHEDTKIVAAVVRNIHAKKKLERCTSNQIRSKALGRHLFTEGILWFVKESYESTVNLSTDNFENVKDGEDPGPDSNHLYRRTEACAVVYRCDTERKPKEGLG